MTERESFKTSVRITVSCVSCSLSLKSKTYGGTVVRLITCYNWLEAYLTDDGRKYQTKQMPTLVEHCRRHHQKKVHFIFNILNTNYEIIKLCFRKFQSWCGTCNEINFPVFSFFEYFCEIFEVFILGPCFTTIKTNHFGIS